MVADDRISDCMNIRSPNKPNKIDEQPKIPKQTTGRNGDTARARKPKSVTTDHDEICLAVSR